MKTTYDINNNCGKRRGCDIGVTLPHDSKLRVVFSRMHGTRNDFSKILSFSVSGMPGPSSMTDR